MTLTPGTRLGPYEIVSRIGAGGMGEVFRARDTRLDRSVAIKMLTPELANDAQLRLRFEREAKTVSQLNHPNICTLYDVGENYLVMELLEGESLVERLARGPMPLPDVLRYGAQIAEALDRAHRAGIIHRDLKPGNVMITKDGAKLLDFGLAKGAGAINVNLDGATEHKPLTQEGTILGTFQYMAPEQLEGAEADSRTDIFALGALLYEMATGQRAFDGKTKTSLIAQIVAATPRPLRELQPLTPPAFEHTVEKCLAKQPDERWQSARDVASELRWVSTLTASQAGAPAVAISTARRRRLGMALSIAAGLAIVALGATVGYLRQRLIASDRLMRVDIAASENLAQVVFGATAISPDAEKIAMVFEKVIGTERELALRDLISGETKVLPGTSGALFPFWSPDGETLGFFANGKLNTIPATGGAVQVLCDAPEGRGASWGTRGDIVFTPNIREPIFKVSEGGGTPVKVTSQKGEATHRNPHFLPDGKTFLYVVRDSSAPGGNGVYASSTEGGLHRRVLESPSNVQYADGYLLYVRMDNLVAQRFDLDELKVSGPPIPVVEKVEYYEPRDVGNFSLSANGALLYRGTIPTSRQFEWFAPDGRALGTAGAVGSYQSGVMSADGRKLVAIVGDDRSHGDVWLLQLDRPGTSRLTFESLGLMSSVISHDGTRIAVGASTFKQGNRLWVQNLTGRANKVDLPVMGDTLLVSGWSPDGESIVVTAQQNATRFDVAAIPVRSGRPAVPLVATVADERNGTVSPDGAWLAYQSNESGRDEIYVTTFPVPEGKVQVSYDGGSLPRWSADGTALYFRNNRKLFSAKRAASGEFDAPVALPITLKVTAAAAATGYTYGVAPDGRVLVLTDVSEGGTNPLRLVLNWRQQLRR